MHKQRGEGTGKKSKRSRLDKQRAENIYKEILNEIAVSENLTVRQVSDILQYTYGFISSKIREGKGEAIRIPKWGLFWVKPFQRKRLEKRNEKSRTTNSGEPLQDGEREGGSIEEKRKDQD